MKLKLSAGQVDSWRMDRHRLVRRARRRDIAQVVSEVCGIQAQVSSAAELAIRARVEGSTQEDVREALWKDHSIVKTWCMRGTLHLLATSDLPVYVAALKTKLPAERDWLQRTQRVRPNEVEAVTKEIGDALERETLTREVLAREVVARTKLSKPARAALMSAWGILLRPAAYQGVLAFGPNVGSKATFLRPDKWVPSWKEPPAGEALLELFERFLRAYGPIALGDFGHWWGSLREEEKSSLEKVLSEFAEVQVGEWRGWMIHSDAEAAAGLEPAHVVRLLPSFDCYAMFYSPREAFVPQAHRSRVFRKTAGWNYPTLVVDGHAVGIWALKRRTRAVDISLELFRELSEVEQKGVNEEVSDIGRFYGVPSQVRYERID